MANANDEYNSDDPLSDDDSTDNTDIDSSDAEDDFDFDPAAWSNVSAAGMRDIPYTGDNKLLIPVPGNNEPIDWFNFFIDLVFLENICRFTNDYALEVFFGPTIMPGSRIHRWKPLTVPELRIFIGILIHMGTIRINRIQDYWKTDRKYNLQFFREYMSRDRFQLILRCLCFRRVHPDAEAPADRLYKIRSIIQLFNDKMRSIYYPSKEMSLDEAMILWRGRLQFRQYVKGKRHKYGVKLYTLCEPEGLIVRFMVYSGKMDDLGGKGHAGNVVLHLMRDFLNKGRALYMDNFYNSVTLASKLLANKTYCTGTLRVDRKFNPRTVVAAKLKKGETTCQYGNGILVGKWRDERDVLYISTQFENEMVTMENRRGIEKQKPKPVVHYNAHMKGVDRADQLMSYYPIERKTIRWYKKIFVHFLQMAMVNCMFFVNMNSGARKMPFLEFRDKLVDSLLPPKPAQPPRTLPRNPLHRLVQNEERDLKGDRKRKRCRVCAKEGLNKRTSYLCSGCPGQPAFCPIRCFDEFHKN
ncbi:piggyBac transposable element-derived protein 4-like [Homalodisca vitripennis]|uniref:piggyBac transposable element-derived protein 4-like n=1 Tax=Homalodisca vitripennis TaxID=197043 RepID=UPI001EEA61D4|nr:piggyBac transposable element-derived protein 4-like [Homalodisca vitripennis]